jgi:hypothetical protein
MATDKTPKPNVEVASKEAVTAEQVVGEYSTHWKYVSGSYHETWMNAWKLYNNQRIQYGYQGISDTFIPLTFSIVESTLANVVGGRPKLTYLPTNKDQTADTKVLDAYADYAWDKSGLQLKVIPWVKDAIMYGTGVLFAYWDVNKNIPGFKNIPLKDFWIDPTVTSIEQAEEEGKPCGFRYLTTKDALKRRMVVNTDYNRHKPEDDKNPSMKPLYNHAEIDAAGEFDPDQTDKEDKEQWLGSTLGEEAMKNQVEVIVRVTKDRWVEVLNRSNIIRDEDNPYECLPFAIQRDFIDPSLFYAKGHVEVIAQRQEELNDNENQDVDNMSYYLDNMATIDPAYKELIPQIKSGPGVVIPVPAGMYVPLPKPAYNNKAGEKRTEIKTDMREAVGAGEILQAGGDPTKKTATEVNAEQMNAGKRFDVMLQVMETDGFQQLGRLLFKLVKLFADDRCVVRVVGSNGIRFETFLKKDYEGEYEPKIQLEASAKTEQARQQLQDDQMFQSLQTNPLINQLELIKMYASKRWNLDQDEVDLLLSNPGNPGEEQPGGMDPSMPADPSMASPMGAAPAPEAPPLDPTKTPVDESGLTPQDLVKLYAAAVSAGDIGLTYEIKQKLGFDPSDDPPLAVAHKQTQMVNDRHKMALEIQRSQLEQERAEREAQQPEAVPAA